MGYYTTMTGEFRIEPPLIWNQIKDGRFTDSREPYEFHIKVVEEEIDTPTGTLTKRTGVAVLPNEQGIKAYEANIVLQDIVNAFPEHKFIGHIQGEGENNTDMWRLYVRSGKVIQHEVECVWPDPPDGDG
jgi:hypothetical protein